jgi:hypothetical protein
MANKKYTDINTGTVYTDSVILVANPTTGALKRVTVAQLLAASGTEPGGGGGGGGGDVTAPTVSSATVPNANPNTVIVVFSESVTVTTAGWSFRRNGSNWAVSSVAGSGNTWTFTMATSAANGETIDRTYNAGTGNTLDGAGNELGAFTNASVTNNVAGGFDTDAQAFFTFTGITDSTIQNAINTHVVSLKTLGLWGTKIQRIYPFVGGTSTRHQADLRNPVSGNNLSYRGTPTHTANGMECGAGDVMAMTNVIPSVSMSISDLSMGVYISQDEQVSSLAKLTMGVVGVNAFSLSIVARFTNDQSYYGMTDSGGNVSPSNTVAPGFYSLSRTASNVGKAFKGGTQVGSTFTSTQTTLPNTVAIGIGGGTADGGTSYLSGENQVRYAYIGLGLTDAEMLDYYNSIQTLQTALSRAV